MIGKDDKTDEDDAQLSSEEEESDEVEAEVDLDVETTDDEAEPEASESATAKKTKAKELTLGDLDATRLYLGEIGFSPLLSAEEEVYFARLALKGDEAARKRMIELLDCSD